MTLITTVTSSRTVEIQTDPLAPPLLVTRAALIAASRAVQSSATGLANVSGRFPHGGAGLVTLDESQISQLVGDLNRATEPPPSGQRSGGTQQRGYPMSSTDTLTRQMHESRARRLIAAETRAAAAEATDPETWRAQALCAQADPDAFFPPPGGTGGNPARRICRECPVQTECLEAALAKPQHEDDYGIWGGTSPKERRAIRAERGVA